MKEILSVAFSFERFPLHESTTVFCLVQRRYEFHLSRKGMSPMLCAITVLFFFFGSGTGAVAYAGTIAEQSVSLDAASITGNHAQQLGTGYATEIRAVTFIVTKLGTQSTTFAANLVCYRDATYMTPCDDQAGWSFGAVKTADNLMRTATSGDIVLTFTWTGSGLLRADKYYCISVITQTGSRMWKVRGSNADVYLSGKAKAGPACGHGGTPDSSLADLYFKVEDGITVPPPSAATNHPPVLSFPQTAPYAEDGLDPNKGFANTTSFSFKVVYTDADNDAPVSSDLVVDDGATTTRNSMVIDTNSVETLHDGTYTNGEQYVFTATFPQGEYRYHFEARDATTTATTTTRLPALGERSFSAGYSSVAFIPGIEASRLYRRDPGCVLVNCENQLWEPNINDDVRKLYLSPTTGESIDPSVYTRDVIGSIHAVITNIYASFLNRMNAMETDGVIDRFEALPYDWRMDVNDVVIRPVQLPDADSYSMISRIEEMANFSQTGRVTLVTHSNGGLVVKELVEELRRRGEEHLIDRIIMVAAPQLGTPEAIIEMLHGTHFLLGFPNKEVTRELAENMKSAYTLLPSREYFNRLRDPLIRPLVEFSETTPVTQNFRTLYGDSISDYDTLRRFLRGDNGVRMEPSPEDVNTPNVLKENFLAGAEARHDALDAWTPPAGIDVVEIIGWGLTTARGVRYESTEKKVCTADLSACSRVEVIDPRPLTTSEGDGTVVYPSAEVLGGERY